ncbi:MAG: hypothetical protein OXC82_10230 [Rhodobacteraceae bacterium]|nr:hypothetical protein [Paracoccaceae bacterium]MCY4250794.1 hypothetical protein [Paracoccaceae bacterium]MCY4307206.1 hypothetical protein [Paracoccaceae bacterium]
MCRALSSLLVSETTKADPRSVLAVTQSPTSSWDYNYNDLYKRDVGLMMLEGQGGNIDTNTSEGRMMFNLFVV